MKIAVAPLHYTSPRFRPETEASMISVLTVLKASAHDPLQFEVGYFDHAKKNDRGYFRTTRCGNETQMRALLASFGVSDDEIDDLFANAKA